MQTAIISLYSISHLMFVMVNCDVFLAVRTEFLNITWKSFGLKGLRFVFYRKYVSISAENL
jgi:hypothetical protein